MRVSSPIGDLPFEPRSLHIRHGGVEIEGVMGAWPARVQLTPADTAALLRLLAKPAALAAALFMIVAVAVAPRLTHRSGKDDR
jgi:hypothetical protein